MVPISIVHSNLNIYGYKSERKLRGIELQKQGACLGLSEDGTVNLLHKEFKNLKTWSAQVRFGGMWLDH
jgi:hypothetical protein